MQNNKFNIFFLKKPESELIQSLLSHTLTGNTLEPEWYNALIIHLKERELNEEFNNVYERILNTSPTILKLQEEELLIKLRTLNKTESNTSGLVLKSSGNYEAGKSLKNVVYIIILWILFSIIGVFVSITSKDFEVIKYAYIFTGIGGFICLVMLLLSVYNAGNNLQKS
jgi:hypothetical protein